jgi:hypothetical protein
MDEMGIRFTRDNPGQGGFATAGRPPQDHGKNPILLNGFANQTALTHDVALADKLRQTTRAHPIRQRPGAIGSLLGMIFEYVHASKTFGFRVIR